MYFEIDSDNALKSALEKMCLRLQSCGLGEDTVFYSKLVARELLTNALQHGGGRAFFRVRLGDGELRISVKGRKAFRPPEESICSGVEAERGRGMYLVDAFSCKRVYSEEEGVIVLLDWKV